MDKKQTKDAVRASLKYSVLDGSAYAAMFGLTSSFVTPLALELKASTFQVSLLSSAPAFMMSLSQLAAPDLTERAGSRKSFILPVVFLHAMMFIPILLVPYIFHVSAVWWLIVFVTASVVLGAVSTPAWGSMMADLVPMRLRGRYFGNRGRIAETITLVFTFVAGGILSLFTSSIFAGYAVLFSGATVFRLISFYFISRQYEPKQAVSKEKGPGLLAMIKNISSSNLGKFMLFFSAIDFCTAISSPFFAVFMRDDLQFSYIAYTCVGAAGSVARILFQPLWGKWADRAGNMKIIRLTSILIVIVPLLWLFNTNVFYLILANGFSGFVWSGYGLAGTNFAYDASEPAHRTKWLSIFGAIDGIAVCVGGILGGLITPHLPDFLGYQLRTLFTISGLGRGVVVLLMMRQISEVRRVADMSYWNLMTGRKETNGDNSNGNGKFTFRKK